VIRPAGVADIDAIVSLWILVGLKVGPGPAARELGGMLAAGTDLILVAELEARLRARGCAKLNLLIEPDNAGVVRFYERIGFCPDELIFMEKWL
jgi:hypothetical protein